MRVLLDADVCIDLTRQRPVASRHFVARAPSDYAISTVVLFELERGTYFTTDPGRERLRVDTLLGAPLTILPFDADAARLCARLDSLMRSQRIGARDLMTAAVALVHDLTVATRNVREFSRVPGLRVEDWSVPA